jgi:hypothetical protein
MPIKTFFEQAVQQTDPKDWKKQDAKRAALDSLIAIARFEPETLAKPPNVSEVLHQLLRFNLIQKDISSADRVTRILYYFSASPVGRAKLAENGEILISELLQLVEVRQHDANMRVYLHDTIANLGHDETLVSKLPEEIRKKVDKIVDEGISQPFEILQNLVALPRGTLFAIVFFDFYFSVTNLLEAMTLALMYGSTRSAFAKKASQLSISRRVLWHFSKGINASFATMALLGIISVIGTVSQQQKRELSGDFNARFQTRNIVSMGSLIATIAALGIGGMAIPYCIFPTLVFATLPRR